MPPTFPCPHCATLLALPEDFTGNAMRCHGCRWAILVPLRLEPVEVEECSWQPSADAHPVAALPPVRRAPGASAAALP